MWSLVVQPLDFSLRVVLCFWQGERERVAALVAEKEAGEQRAEAIRRRMEEDTDAEIEALRGQCGSRLLPTWQHCRMPDG